MVSQHEWGVVEKYTEEHEHATRLLKHSVRGSAVDLDCIQDLAVVVGRDEVERVTITFLEWDHCMLPATFGMPDSEDGKCHVSVLKRENLCRYF